MGKTVTVATDRAFDQTKTILPAEVARGVYMRNAPSLRALKLMHLMIATAGGRMAEDVRHEIRLSEIRGIEGMAHHDTESIKPLFEELRAAVLTYDDTEAMKYTIGGLLDQAVVDYRHEISGEVLVSWYFGRMFRDMAEKSNHWAILDRQTVFHLGSKYSVLLFQHIASLVNLDKITAKTFTIPELRAVLGVPEGTHKRFAELNRWALQASISEINQLSRMSLVATTNKIGRTVASVTISWQVKEDPTTAKRELQGHSAGRKARRDGSADMLAPAPFPATGGFTYSPDWQTRFESAWAVTGRPHNKRPDSARVADHVRSILKGQNLPLDSPRIEVILGNVVKNWKVS